MTYVVTEKCIKCKYTDCVEVCPVDCFYEGNNMLVINPDECIDCGVCEPECPVNAIVADSKLTKEKDGELLKWLEINKKYASEWPSIKRKKDPYPGCDEYKNENGKYDKYFYENDKK